MITVKICEIILMVHFKWSFIICVIGHGSHPMVREDTNQGGTPMVRVFTDHPYAEII